MQDANFGISICSTTITTHGGNCLLTDDNFVGTVDFASDEFTMSNKMINHVINNNITGILDLNNIMVSAAHAGCVVTSCPNICPRFGKSTWIKHNKYLPSQCSCIHSQQICYCCVILPPMIICYSTTILNHIRKVL